MNTNVSTKTKTKTVPDTARSKEIVPRCGPPFWLMNSRDGPLLGGLHR